MLWLVGNFLIYFDLLFTEPSTGGGCSSVSEFDKCVNSFFSHLFVFLYEYDLFHVPVVFYLMSPLPLVLARCCTVREMMSEESL